MTSARSNSKDRESSQDVTLLTPAVKATPWAAGCCRGVRWERRTGGKATKALWSGVHLVMNRVCHLALALALLASATRGLAAQTAAEPENWRVSFTPYVWMSGLKGTIGVGSSITEVDVAFTDGAEDFDFGFAGLLEGRRYPWVLRTDFYYVALSDEAAVSGG